MYIYIYICRYIFMQISLFFAFRTLRCYARHARPTRLKCNL